ncbi:uncharacterized protein METZ01_LOCUS438506, partial [marine metagenome]
MSIALFPGKFFTGVSYFDNIITVHSSSLS